MEQQLEIHQIRRIVRTLNKAFNRNHFYKTPMAPFKGVLTSERGWLILCDDHYTWSDNPRFKNVKRMTTMFDYIFKFEFDGMKTIRLTKKMIVK
jgi:hypothetical protein